MTASRGVAVKKAGRVRQLHSHARLLRDVSRVPAAPGRSRGGRPDAIIVPTGRPASVLTGLIELAADLETRLVVLCSMQANPDQVAERMGRMSGVRGLVVHLDDDYSLPLPDKLATSAPKFMDASAGRTSDLSLKRNFGLLLARSLGWSKIVFLDDDITVLPHGIARLVHHLDDHHLAGMVCDDYPDNSVVCHARRLAGLPQDTFVTGAVLGVQCSDLPLPFFPDVYNEDWFAVGESASRRLLAKAGQARQAPYDPFAGPARAQYEEFGDLLAEGLYGLIEDGGPERSFRQVTHDATAAYWRSFIEARRETVAETMTRLNGFAQGENCSDDVYSAIISLEAAEYRYTKDPIEAETCVDFLRAWEHDVEQWERFCVPTARDVADAMTFLGPPSWRAVG